MHAFHGHRRPGTTRDKLRMISRLEEGIKSGPLNDLVKMANQAVKRVTEPSGRKALAKWCNEGRVNQE